MSSILVVEDDAIIRQDIQATLERLGYSVPCAVQSGAEALAALESQRPDLVLMDIRLKGPLDGIETAAKLKHRWDVPVVYLTSHADDGTITRAKETSPHGYLLKPFDERDLRTTIEVAIRKHQLEKKLADRERWFSTTLDSIGDAVIATDVDERITFMNPVAETVTGWREQDALGQKVADVFRLVDKSGEAMPSPVGRAIRGGFHVAVPAGAQLVTKLGTSKLIDDAATPIVDDRGNVLGGVAVFRDVTERRRLEERLALSERLASIGTMAAGTAHEINNPLSATLANVEFALQKLSGILLAPAEGDADTASRIREVVEALSDAHHAGERVRKIVGELKKFARAEQATRSPIDLPDVLDAAIKLTEHQVRHSARLLRLYGTTPLIDANEGRLVQVFTNLILNAAQAVASSPASGNVITITTRTDAAGRAEVEVRDNGPGIAQEHIGRIFDVFFTTKPTGAGTGLGLSICHSIVEDLGGELTVSSDSGNGAAFRVAIPPASGISAPPSSVPVRLPGRRGRVLSIDDEEAVSRTVERILKDHHDVVTETDARAALARIARGERFDVILCDLMMPGMNGMDFYEAIRTADAELARRIVFVSGGVFSDRASKFLEGCTNLALEKPFSVERLRAVVADYVA